MLGVLAGSTVLLHLPFAGDVTELRGPGRPAGPVAGRGDRQLRGHGRGGAGGGAHLLITAVLVLTNVTVAR